MKKNTAFALLLNLFFLACSTSSNTEKRIETSSDSSASDTISQKITTAVYICPMDCENGKTYADTGKCPVCEMELEKK